MKIDNGVYIPSGFCSFDDDAINYRKKVVKCKKNIVCASCRGDIKKGEQALCETGFIDDETVSVYTCLDCIKEWLDD